MFNIVLFQPEIPPNTGNIMRLCSNTGATLHLIHPLGFELDDRKLRRAGLDYLEWTGIRQYATLEECLRTLGHTRVIACSTRGRRAYADVTYRSGDALLFGPETRGLPAYVLDQIPPADVVRIPMQPQSRSLNLSNAVAVILYEAWRQSSFRGGD